ncbi:MAG: hypothetical protein AAFY35_07100 [Pseudomonadota bacterium]
MCRFAFFAVTACLAAPSVAQEIDTSVDFTALNRGQFVDEARRVAEASWVGSMVIFSRIDASVAQAIPAFPWNEDFVTAYSCIYDDMSTAGTLNEYNAMRDESVKFLAFVEQNPEVTLLTIDQYDEALDLMVPSDITIAAMQGCGLMTLNQEAMVESGLMQAVTQFFAEQDE